MLSQMAVETREIGEILNIARNVSKIIDGHQKELDTARCKLRSYTYSINELEAMRFVNVNDQKRRWKEVYQSLGSDVVKEYDVLRVPNNQNKKQKKKKDAAQKIMEEVLAVKATTSQSGPDVLNICGQTLDCNGNDIDVDVSLDDHDDLNDEDDSSNDDYESIQRPAFLVEGEPDFESGPPLDGLEYLRRVRWEASQIPKVKVVKLNSSKFTNEQTAYMPSIPEIPKCPPNLLPSKDWERAFLADFSDLRKGISVLENSCNERSLDKQSDCLQQLKKNTPTLTAILGMDAVCRAATLRNSISSLETASVLSKDDCLWLFAICAAVDTPLHADTCASLRCLLRKCSGLLAVKSEPDDEVAMLCILLTITGKYFGQLDS